MVYRVSDLSYAYGKDPVLNRLSFSLQPGQILVIMGPTGCGKSTLLKLLAGLLQTPHASALQAWAGFYDVVYLPQDAGLLPWLNVWDNLALPFRASGRKTDTVNTLLERAHLSDAWDKYPFELSEGMKRRTLLMQALAIGGEVLLLDEAFSALDDWTGRSIRMWLRGWIREEQWSGVFVTHHIEEAFECADHILVLGREGQVLRYAPAPDIHASEIRGLLEGNARGGT